MDANILYEAIGEIGDEYIVDAETAGKRKRKWTRGLIAACVAMALLAVPVSAEFRTGYVSNLLAPLYGSTQTELIDSVGVPIGASVTVGDYTLTAEAMIGDRYHVAIVYALVHKDGEVLPEGLRFETQWSTVLRGSGGGSLEYSVSEDGTVLNIIEKWECSNPLLLTNRIVEVSFHNLGVWNGETETFTRIAGGDWDLALTLRYEDSTVEIPAGGRTFYSAEGNDYQIQRIYLSPIGIHLDMTMPNPHLDGFVYGPTMADFAVDIKMKDGTVVGLAASNNRGSSGELDAARYDATYGAIFPQPLAPEDVAAIIICGTEFPVDLTQ